MVVRRITDREVNGVARELSFSRLTGECLTSFYRLATAILGDPVEAEDATHDAAIKAWEHWGSLRDLDRFEAWFQRILLNECRDRLRRNRRRPIVLPLPEGRLSPTISDGSGDFAEYQALARAVSELTVDQRIVVVLHYYLDLSAEEIARLIGVRSGTVKSRIHYAVSSLRATSDAEERGR